MNILRSADVQAVMFNDTGRSNSVSKNGISLELIISLLVAMSVIALLGNVLVCAAIYTQPRLRNLTYYPVLSLAIADMSCALFAMPSYLLKKFSFDTKTEMMICDLFRFSYFFTEYASILSLMVISIERFVAIQFGFKWHKDTLTKWFIVLLFIVWIEAALVSSIPFFWQHSSSENCHFKPTKAWSIMVIVTQVLCPFFLITLAYYSIYSVARRHEKQINANTVRCPKISESRGLQSRKNSYTWKRERKSTLTLAIVLGLFVVCWGPSTVYYFLQMVCTGCFSEEFQRNAEPLVKSIVKLLTFFNSSINPFIYCWRSRDFRAGFARILSRLPVYPESTTPRGSLPGDGPSTVLSSIVINFNKSQSQIDFSRRQISSAKDEHGSDNRIEALNINDLEL